MAFSPAIQSLLLNDLTKVYSEKAPSICVVSELYGIDAAIFWVKTQLLSLDFFNGTKQDAEEDAMNELASLIAHRYQRLLITEIILFVARFKLGEYGKFYGSFDPIAVGEALKEFVKERALRIDAAHRVSEDRKRVARKFVPPEGFTSLSWYQHLKERAAAGDAEAIELLLPPKDRPT